MAFNRFARFASFALTIAFISASGNTIAQEKPRVSLPLQVGFFNGATALYITPKVGVDSVPVLSSRANVLGSLDDSWTSI